MKCVLTKGVFATGTVLCGLFAAGFAATADEPKPQAAASAETTAPLVQTEDGKNAKSQSTSWLDEHGAITTEQVVQELGIRVTEEQRVQIEKAVQKRNRALQEANADLSAALSKTLATNDSELAKRSAEQRERRRMEIIRSRQPGSYNGMKK